MHQLNFMNRQRQSIPAKVCGPSRGWFNVCFMGLTHFTSDFYCNVLPVMLPLLALRFGLSYSMCGMLFMIFQVSSSFIQPPVGVLADRRDVNSLMPLSILTGGIFACAVGLCPNVYILCFVILLAGICSSGYHPIAGGIVPHICPPKHEVFATSVFIAGGNIGFAVAPVLIALFMESCGDQNLIFLSIPAIIVTAVIYMRRLHIKDRQGPAIEVPSTGEMLRNKNFVWFTVCIGLRSWGYCALVSYLALLLTSHGHSTVQSATAIMVMLLGTATGGLATGGLAGKFGLKSVIASSFVIAFIFFAYFLYDPSLSFVSYAALFITGAALYGSTPAAIVWSKRVLGGSSAAFATSMMLGFTFGIGYTISIFTGFIGDLVNLRFGLAVTCLPALVLALVILLSLKEPRADPKEAASMDENGPAAEDGAGVNVVTATEDVNGQNRGQNIDNK